ncbi:MAG: hypothetical protein ACRDK8_00120, partial [Solirubrobacteraceae bacterium]
MSVGSIGALLACLAAGWRYHTRSRRALHLLQLEHYENARLFVWLRRRGELTDPAQSSTQASLAIIALVLTVTGPTLAQMVAWLALLAALAAWHRREPVQGEIK